MHTVLAADWSTAIHVALNLLALVVAGAAVVVAWRVVANSRGSIWWFVLALLLIACGSVYDGVWFPMMAIVMLVVAASSGKIRALVRGAGSAVAR